MSMRTLILNMACLFILTAEGSAQKYVVEHFTPDQGLASNATYQVLQDRYGFMWFACAGGLNIFDGYQFRTFTIADGLPHTSIRCMAEDMDGWIWIGTENGVACYASPWRTRTEPHSGLFKNFTGHFRNIGVHTLLIDRDNKLWIGTNDHGLIMADLQFKNDSTAFINSFKIFSDRDGLTRSAIRYLYDDDEGTLWIAADDGLYSFDKLNAHVRRFTEKDGLRSMTVYAILKDRALRLWIGTAKGVNILDMQSRTVLQEPQNMNIRTINTPIYHMMQDKKGLIWLATRDEGALRYDPVSFAVTKFTTRNGLGDNRIQQIYQDRENSMWFATYSTGINHLITENFLNYTLEDGLPNKLVLSVREDPSGKIWIGTNEGLAIYDGNTIQKIPAMKGNAVWAIQPQANHYWIGTDQGLFKLNDAGNLSGIYTTREGLIGNSVRDLAIDREGLLWIATNVGLSVLNINTKRFVNYTTDNGLPINYIRSLFLDKDGRMWLGTRGGGLCRVVSRALQKIELEVHNVDNGFPNNTIGKITQNRDGYLWIATHAGVVKIDPQPSIARIAQHLSVKDGLTHNLVSYVTEDSAGHLWICTDKGVDEVDLRHGFRLVTHYNKKSGMIGEEFTTHNSVTIDRDGHFWFGFFDGITHYIPTNDERTNIAPLVYLTNASAMQKSDQFLTINLFEQPQNAALGYDHNTINFQFTALAFKNVSLNRYRYKLTGFDDQWSELTDQRSVRYTNLPEGVYTFQVMAVNADGIWSKTPTDISFSIASPFWATWWFRGFGGLFLIAGLYAGYQFRLRKIQERNRSLENRIAQRTQELQEKNEQLRELNQLKDEFLNIAAHDLRNPLNSILCTSKILMEETKKQNYKPDEFLSDDLELMHRASEHMLVLINNLLDIAKIEAGKIELQLENRDIIKLIREQIEEIRTIAKQKEIKIEFKPGYNELVVKIDKEKMWQAVSNLLSNAVKFTDRGGQVQVSVSGGHEEIQVSVEDSGRGIPHEKIDQVFNKFSDLSRVGTDGERGTGLGMAITKKIIELHGGRIWVESENGRGTRFTFTLHSQENHAS